MNYARKHSFRSFFFCCTLLLVTSLLIGCQSQEYAEDHEQLSEEERIVIRFSHVVGEETPKGLAARRFAQLMKERTNGFIEVQVFPNGYLYKDGEEIDAFLKGDIQMIAPATSKLSSIVPEVEVIDLPFAFDNVEQVHEYLSGPIGGELMESLELAGFHTLDIWDNGFKQITNNRNQLIAPVDFDGLRFRIMPSHVLNIQFTQLGAVPQSFAFNEVFQLLEGNIIDGVENTLSNITSKDLHSMQNYITLSNHGYLGYFVLINKSFWDQLPQDIQLILQETLYETTEWEANVAKKLNEEQLERLVQCECLEIHSLEPEEREHWEEAFKPVYEYFEARFGAKYIDHLPKFQQGRK